MKILLFLLFILLNKEALNESSDGTSNPDSSSEGSSNQDSVKVVNSCGAENIKASNTQPNKVDDCKDPEEPACKFVTVQKDDDIKKFCAIIHGKYNDEEVISEVNQLINGKITVEGKGFYVKAEYLLIFIFILLF